MSPRAQWLVLGAILVLTAAGFGALYQLRLNRGDSFPAYSSRRADPLGTRALYDSLAELPALHVSRRFEPLSDVEATKPRTIILAGFEQADWIHFPKTEFRALDAAARNGGRVVIAMRAVHDLGEAEVKEKTTAKSAEEKPVVEKKSRTVKPKAPREFVDPGKLWGAALKTRWLMRDAQREPGVAKELPAQLRWGSDIYFLPAAGSPWRVVYRRGTEPVLLERPLGRGTLVLAGDAYIVSNEALQRDRAPALLAWIVGANPEIEFDEQHLGVTENRGVAALARSYGLGGAASVLAIFAALFVWSRMALFVPPAEESAEIALVYNQTAGLEALLRRAVPRAGLAEACIAEWRRTARPDDAARADAARAACPANVSPAVIYNAITTALRKR